MGPESGNAIHIGPSYSCTEIITVLYNEILNINPKDPNWFDRDRFIISKGHATPVLYAQLAQLGYFDREQLWDVKNVDCILQGHPCMLTTPGIDMNSGSLGNGLPVALGMAIGLKQMKNKASVFVLVGDGEFQEGATLEAMMAAPNKGADNLTVVLDYNHHQSAGSVEDIMPLHPLADKWKSFGWNVMEVDGHNIPDLYSKLAIAKNFMGRPTCIIAHTIKGKGISFMENNNAWHVKLPSEDEYTRGMEELENIDSSLSKQ